eukprot:GILJ01009947.1.p1 GENE.GILJ01009947.1~~GILJ01009947.1.p1  ORF type:complete len:303 (+),score=11.41 GILJ01009947.1:36-944(+)
MSFRPLCGLNCWNGCNINNSNMATMKFSSVFKSGLVVFLVFALVSALIGGLVVGPVFSAVASWKPATCTVWSGREESVSLKKTWRASLNVSYVDEMQLLRYATAYDSIGAAYTAGRKLDFLARYPVGYQGGCFYNPRDKSEATMELSIPWWCYLIPIIFGLSLLCVCHCLLWSIYNRQHFKGGVTMHSQPEAHTRFNEELHTVELNMAEAVPPHMSAPPTGIHPTMGSGYNPAYSPTFHPGVTPEYQPPNLGPSTSPMPPGYGQVVIQTYGQPAPPVLAVNAPLVHMSGASPMGSPRTFGEI